MLIFTLYLKNIHYVGSELDTLCRDKQIVFIREHGGGKQLYELSAHPALASASTVSASPSSVLSSSMTSAPPLSGNVYEAQYEQCLALDNMRITAEQYKLYLFLKTMIDRYYEAVGQCLWKTSFRYIDEAFACFNHIDPLSVWKCLENTESPLIQQERECLNNALKIDINFATCEAHYNFVQPSFVLEEMMHTLEGTYSFLDPV